MQVGVELAVGIDRLDAVAFQGGDQLAVGSLDAVQHRDDGGVGCRARLLRHGGQGAGEIVGDADHVAGEPGHGILAGLDLLAGGDAADILGLGHGAQALVFELGIFQLEGVQHGEFGRVRVLGIGELGRFVVRIVHGASLLPNLAIVQ